MMMMRRNFSVGIVGKVVCTLGQGGVQVSKRIQYYYESKTDMFDIFIPRVEFLYLGDGNLVQFEYLIMRISSELFSRQPNSTILN